MSKEKETKPDSRDKIRQRAAKTSGLRQHLFEKMDSSKSLRQIHELSKKPIKKEEKKE